MYTIEDELQWWHEKFKEDAFFDDRGKLVFQSKTKLNTDLGWFLIVNHHDYKHEWWKNYVGILFLGKMIFHIVPKTNVLFLYEVMPVHVDKEACAVHGRRIKADSLCFISEAVYVVVKV